MTTICAGAAQEETIYEALRNRLGREPTDAELKVEVKRILEEATREERRRLENAHIKRGAK